MVRKKGLGWIGTQCPGVTVTPILQFLHSDEQILRCYVVEKLFERHLALLLAL